MTFSHRNSILPRKRPRRCGRRSHTVVIWPSEGLLDGQDAQNGAGSDADSAPHGNDLDGESHFEPDGLTDGGGDTSRSATATSEEHSIHGGSWVGEGPHAGAEAETAAAGDGDGGDDVSTTCASDRRLYAALCRYSKGPEDVDGIRRRTSDEAAHVLRCVVTGIFGTIPADSFDAVVNTEPCGKTRLMQSSIATGYALRNAEHRIVLSAVLTGAGAPLPRENIDVLRVRIV